MRVAALDIGGSKLAAASVDASYAVGEVGRLRTPTTDKAACLAALQWLLEPLLDDADAVGICTAGPFTAGNRPRPVNIPALHDVDLADQLGRWSGRSVVVLNDAQALALAEGVRGAARGVSNHAVVTVSTGVGAGIVMGGRLLSGGTGNAGHLGHVQVNPTGPPCGCGRLGCLESLISGAAMARRTGAPAESAAPALVLHAAGVLGRALVELVTLLDLEQITLAGSVSLGWGEPFRAAVEDVLRDSGAFGYARQVPVVLSELGVTSGLIGAAAFTRAELSSGTRR